MRFGNSLGKVIRDITLASALTFGGCTAPNLGYLLGVDGGADSSGTPDGRTGRKDTGSTPAKDMPTLYQDGPVVASDIGRKPDLGTDAPRPDRYLGPDAPPDAPLDVPDASLDAPYTPDAGADAVVADATGPTPDTAPTPDATPAPDAVVGSDSGIPFLEDLVGMWRFDEALDGDATILDSSGNEYVGTVESATRIAGRRGNALDFDVDNARVIVPGVPGFGLGSSLTFSVWYQARSYDSNPGSGNTLAHLGRALGESGDYNFGIRFNQGKLQFNFLQEGGSEASTWQSDEPFTIPVSDSDGGPVPAAWHKLDIAFTYGDASSFRAYRDGVLIAGSWGGTDGSAAPYIPSSSLLTLGAYQQSGDFSQEFDGVMDDARLYDRALSEEELLDLFERESSE